MSLPTGCGQRYLWFSISFHNSFRKSSSNKKTAREEVLIIAWWNVFYFENSKCFIFTIFIILISMIVSFLKIWFSKILQSAMKLPSFVSTACFIFVMSYMLFVSRVFDQGVMAVMRNESATAIPNCNIWHRCEMWQQLISCLLMFCVTYALDLWYRRNLIDCVCISQPTYSSDIKANYQF